MSLISKSARVLANHKIKPFLVEAWPRNLEVEDGASASILTGDSLFCVKSRRFSNQERDDT
jgi:hypothetical protein